MRCQGLTIDSFSFDPRVSQHKRMSYFEFTRLNPMARLLIWLMPLILLACAGNEPQPIGPYRAGPQPWSYAAPSGFRANALENGENFLSDLSFTKASNGWGALELDRSNGDKLEADGPTLSLNGKKYGKGLGVHAPSEIHFDLAGKCSVFNVLMGLDDEVKSSGYGSVTFEILADGVQKFRSATMKPGESKMVRVDLTGVRELRLIVSDAGDNNWYDRADWINPKLNCSNSNTPGSGIGLTGVYYPGPEFTGPSQKRNDARVNFSWDEASPTAGIPSENWNAIWSGLVQVPSSGEWTFITKSDDGVRLRINGRTLIDDWTPHPTMERSGKIKLEAGILYEITLEYRQANGAAVTQLFWESPTQPRQLVPNTRLFPAVSSAGTKGRWGPLMRDWPAKDALAIHATVLPTGKVLVWGGGDKTFSDRNDPTAHNGNDTYLWDPSSDAQTLIRNTTTEIFCAGHALTPEGNLLVNGGHLQNDYGKIDTNLFNTKTSTWSRVQDMKKPRWYPSLIALANGEMLSVGGTIEPATPKNKENTLPQVWQTAGGWRDLNSADDLLGGATGYYPWVFAGPNAKTFAVGPADRILSLSTAANGAWTELKDTRDGLYRYYGSAVMIAPDKVLVVGGTDTFNPASALSAVVSLTGASSVSPSGEMRDGGRTQLNTTVMPDGSVLATGGHGGKGFEDLPLAKRTAERWNPNTGQWTLLEAETNPRMYHSVALLLPDARVLSAGGGRCEACLSDYADGQIFSPPYLYNPDGTSAPRPSILETPDVIGFGQTFALQTTNPAGIGRVSLVRLSSVTHSFNMNQRFAELNFATTGSGLSVTAPSSGDIAPPGHYLLFIINAQGVPSVGRIVQLR
jgi:NPCBM/NEW2 domain/PA14 domain/Domain of unknown function (DUF1929)